MKRRESDLNRDYCLCRELRWQGESPENCCNPY